jgi:hypothetical protein
MFGVLPWVLDRNPECLTLPLAQHQITAAVGKNLVWGHTGDGIPRWIWIE